MAIIIESIIEQFQNECLCSVLYADHSITCLVDGSYEFLSPRIGKLEIVEFDYLKISKATVLSSLDEMHCSGLYQASKTTVNVIGKIHDSMQLESDTVLYDLYMMKSADFLHISSEDIEMSMAKGQFISVEAIGFKAFITNT